MQDTLLHIYIYILVFSMYIFTLVKQNDLYIPIYILQRICVFILNSNQTSKHTHTLEKPQRTHTHNFLTILFVCFSGAADQHHHNHNDQCESGPTRLPYGLRVPWAPREPEELADEDAEIAVVVCIYIYIINMNTHMLQIFWVQNMSTDDDLMMDLFYDLHTI